MKISFKDETFSKIYIALILILAFIGIVGSFIKLIYVLTHKKEYGYYDNKVKVEKVVKNDDLIDYYLLYDQKTFWGNWKTKK